METAGINEFEHIRESLRDLMKYIPKERNTYPDIVEQATERSL